MLIESSPPFVSPVQSTFCRMPKFIPANLFDHGTGQDGHEFENSTNLLHSENRSLRNKSSMYCLRKDLPLTFYKLIQQ